MQALRRWSFLIFTSALASLAGCHKPAAEKVAVPLQVGVMQVSGKTTDLPIEIVGDVRAFREVQLRPRVSGVVEQQLFRPGQMVKEGDPLFLIDTRSLDSAVADAQARLLESEAALQRAQQDVERYKPLLVDDAIPRQTYEQAVSSEKQAVSVVESRREGLNRARIDRSYAEVRAPVTGQIGLQMVEVGGLASAGQTVLATVSTLNPVVVYFSVSETEHLTYTKRLQAGRLSGANQDSQAGKNGKSTNLGSDRETERAALQLLLADGSVYPHEGKLDFADRAISTKTGTLTLRAVFPNPENTLLPGMTGRVRIIYDVAENAILVPQKAVTELLGRSFVSVVGADNKVEQRAVTTGDRLGEQWVVKSGLKAGETIVVEGVQKARPGMTVKPVPATSVAVSGTAGTNAASSSSK